MQPQTLRKTFQNRNKLISNSCMKITRHHHRDHAENRKWRSVTDLIDRLDVGNCKPATCKIDFPKSAVRGSWKRQTFVTRKCRVDRYRKYRIPIYRHQNTGKYRKTGIFNVFFLSQTELLTVEKNQVLTKY